MKQTILSIAALLTTHYQSRHVEKRIHLLRIRAGAVSEEDELLDAYINQLIASIDDDPTGSGTGSVREIVEERLLSEKELDEETVLEQEDQISVEEHEEMEKVYHDTATNLSVGSELAFVAKDNQVNDVQEIFNVSKTIVLSRSVDTTLKVTADASALDMLGNASAKQEVQPTKLDPGFETPLAAKATKRKKRTAIEIAPVPMENTHAESTSEASTEISAPPRPPNPIYRFLLNQGRLGHVIVMICVWISEYVQTYIPQLATFMIWIASTIFPVSSSSRGGGLYVPLKKVNEQYAGFVSTDGTSVRGKKNQAATRKADKKALEQLRRIGSVKEAKYRHVSVNFMKRHQIGQFSNSEEDENYSFLGKLDSDYNAITKGKFKPNEEGDDTAWVVEALTKPERKKGSGNMFDSIKTSVSLESSGATVGLEFSIGGGKRNKNSTKKRNAIVEAATRSTSSRRRPVRSKASDREGGGGVMGRLRDLSANNLVSRSLFGAYPGDAVAPSEAASAKGVFDLASRYGYGDWSDDEVDMPVKRRRKKASSSLLSSTREGKRLSSTTPRTSVSLNFDVSPSMTHSPQKNSRSAIFPNSHVKNMIVSGKKNDILVRAPMDRLREAKRKLEESEE